MGDVEVLDADISGQAAVVDRGTGGDGDVEPALQGERVAALLAGNRLDRVGVCPDRHAGVADERDGGRTELQHRSALVSSGRYVSDRGLPVGVHRLPGTLRGGQRGCEGDLGARGARDAVDRAIGKAQPAVANVTGNGRPDSDRLSPGRC